MANSVTFFCLTSVHPSSVQRAGHEGAHSGMVRGTRHAGRPEGRGTATHTDPEPGVSSSHQALGAPGFHLGPGCSAGDVRANDQADETECLTSF